MMTSWRIPVCIWARMSSCVLQLYNYMTSYINIIIFRHIIAPSHLMLRSGLARLTALSNWHCAGDSSNYEFVPSCFPDQVAPACN